MATTLTGKISVHTRGFGFLVDPTDAAAPSAFIPPPDLNRFLADDVVTATIEVAGEKRTARDLKLVSRPRTRLFGSALTRNGQTFLRVDRLVANTDWPLVGTAPDAALVVARIDGTKAVVEKVVSGVDAEVEALLVRHNLAAEHASAVLEAAASAPAPDMGARRDLRGAVTVTIDGPSTRDIDDALLAYPPDGDGAIRVIVAIADVGSVVTAGGVLDDDARARATSVYLPGRVLPMIPARLSEDLLSLNEGQERPSLTAELRIDVEGNVTAVDVHEAIICSTARLTYDAVARFLDGGDGSAVPPATHDTLRLLRAAAARLSQARAERGGKDVEREEISVRLDEQGAPTGVETRGTDVAHLIVERLMVAANEAVARWLLERGLPGVYRVHDAPTAERTGALADAALGLGMVAAFSPHAPLSPRALAAFDRQFRGTRDEAAVESMLRRLLGPARYTTAPSMHFGLAAPLYLHFTSPIRRYADLLVHRIVKRYLHGERNLPARDDALEAICAHLNEKSRSAARAESERERMLLARLLAKKIGQEVRGVVVGHKPQGTLILVDGSLALLPGETRPLGESLMVVVNSVDEELGRVDVALP